MPRTIPIQTSFAGGEISPKLKGRVDTELWKKGLEECINFEPLAHGPLLSRGGTRHAYDFTDLHPGCKVFEFPRLGDVGFLLVIGGIPLASGGSIRVRSGLDGSPVSADTDYLFNPRFTYGWSYWDTEHVQIINGRHLLEPAPGSGAWRGQIWQDTISLPAGSYTFKIRGSTAVGNWMNVFIGTTGLASSDLLDIDFVSGALSNYTSEEHTITLAAPSVVSVLVEAGTTNWEAPTGLPHIAAEVLEVAIRSTGGGVVEWTALTTPWMPWTNDQLDALQVVAEPARDRVMFFHPEVAPHELLFDSVTGAWTFGAITFTFTDPLLPDWESPNFPGVAELYQGRLLVAGIKGKPNTLLGSKSGEPYDFTLGTNAGDAFSLDVSTKGAIRWLQGHRSLLLGTDRGSSIVLAQGGVLTPSDFEVRSQDGFGAADVQAIQVGDVALYVSRDRRRIRQLSFNLQENGWSTRDLTFTSEHLTGGLVREIDWLSTGNDQVLAVMHSGDVVAWTFNRAEQVVAPWRLDFGTESAPEDDVEFGKVLSMCVIEAGDQDKVWMLVQRAGRVSLEEWIVDDDSERCLLDSYVSATPVAGVVSGLTHLVGATVIPIVDGIIAAAQVVSAGGTITVSVDALSVVVGIYSPREFTTLPRADGQPGGTGAGSKHRFTKLSLRLNDSAIPLVDQDRAAPDRSPETSMGEVEPRMSGDVTARLLGWSAKGAVTVTQDKPIRTEILAIFGVLSTSEV